MRPDAPTVASVDLWDISGTENTFQLAGYVVVDAEGGVERGAPRTCRAIEKGAEVVISYSAQAGKKTAVVVKRI